MFLKNKNIIFKIRRSKVTDYAALKYTISLKFINCDHILLKLGHNVKNTKLSFYSLIMIYIIFAIMSNCPLLMKNYNFYDVQSLNRVILIRTLSNLFTMLITKMCFWSFKMVN